MTEHNPGHRQKLRSGHDDHLEALTPLDVGALGSVDGLLRAMSRTAFGGRRLGEAADVLEAMVRDERCLKVVTVAGAMTIAKQGLVLCEMIDRGWVQAVVATGALMTHGFVEGAGMTHFKHRRGMDDTELFDKGYNRVYDTLELEQNLDDAEKIVSETLDGIPESTTLCSYVITEALGGYLARNVPGRAVLKSAVARGVPVYVPAFTDSELGLDVAVYNRRRAMQGKARRPFDPFLDLEAYTDQIRAAERIGIFTIGGGVPRNWAQQVGPYLDISQKRLGVEEPFRRFHYGVRICPEPDHWGGLSGCTYSEGVSWGKFVPESEGGRFAEVMVDATIGWPLVVRAVIERMGRG
ncbi:MAG TPA: deoxyhypusine synthase family protein [Myxococcota bacterium]|jgi:deoxyhypusine synthase|nr:deoxyhypusine synthase family protein [Myxococcota bacterium]